ncbi:hypothetical protein MEP402_gp01 [Methylophilales phage MEP402]|nr:hypothetical protein MEP402_gp01 [Methylophilales phage MEP402]
MSNPNASDATVGAKNIPALARAGIANSPYSEILQSPARLPQGAHTQTIVAGTLLLSNYFDQALTGYHLRDK